MTFFPHIFLTFSSFYLESSNSPRDTTVQLGSRALRANTGRRNKFSKFYSALASGLARKPTTTSKMDVYTESFEPTTRPSTVAWTKPNYHDSDSTLDLMDLTGIDPRALAPIESTFKIEFEGFDPNTEAKDDPIFRETRAKLTNLTISLNQINNFGRGDVFLSQVRLEWLHFKPT